MKQISGPAGIVIIVVLAIVAIAVGYKYLAGPSKISPQDTQKMMNSAQGRGTDAGHAAPNTGRPVGK
jgi:hypothetical protein